MFFLFLSCKKDKNKTVLPNGYYDFTVTYDDTNESYTAFIKKNANDDSAYILFNDTFLDFNEGHLSGDIYVLSAGYTVDGYYSYDSENKIHSIKGTFVESNYTGTFIISKQVE